MKNCPKCRTTTLQPASERASRMLRCSRCEGVWLPKNEARIRAVAEVLVSDLSIVPGATVDARTGLCPDGHAILTRARIPGEQSFFVERCPCCLGYWFDRGEWKRLAARGLTANLDLLWDPRWAKALRRAHLSVSNG